MDRHDVWNRGDKISESTLGYLRSQEELMRVKTNIGLFIRGSASHPLVTVY
jgi:hypothetical protein